MKRTHILITSAITMAVVSVPALSGTPVSDLAKQVGMNTCSIALTTVEKKIFKDRKFRTHHAINTKSPLGHAFNSISIMDYKGDDSHVILTASPTTNGGCDVSYVESYSLNENCISTRAEAFSKFDQLGKMHETLVMQYKRDPELLAYLTPQRNSGSCLVTKRRMYYADK